MSSAPSSALNSPSVAEPEWSRHVRPELLHALDVVCGTMADAEVEVLLGGAFALARHVDRWRETKDVDFFIRPRDRERAIAALLSVGFQDYHDQNRYDRSWIFRAHRPDALVDVIWTLPNHVTEVDDSWFSQAAHFTLRGRAYRTVPAEELVWIKSYVMQRDRCDWPDVINILRAKGAHLDWSRLLARVGDDAGLLHASLVLFNWLAPEHARDLPDWIRTRFNLIAPSTASPEGTERRRASMLDSRPWYAASLPVEATMFP
jgi:hypothetical protein